MKMVKFFYLALLVIFGFMSSQGFQAPVGGPSKQVSISNKRGKKEKSNTAFAVRHNSAISLLSSLANEAQKFDSRLRSHVQAEVANLLWPSDKIFARDLFLKAWESAETSDRDTEIEEHRQDSTAQPSSMGYPRDARREVIFLVLQNDPALGEQLLAKMTKQDEKENSQGDNSNVTPEIVKGSNLSATELDRISVARQLLENGDTDRAFQVAGEALNRVVIPTLRFLTALRERDPSSADRFYASLLSRVAIDPGADGNTVSLLSSYILSPSLYVRISNNGFPVLLQTPGPNGPADISNNIRSAFLSAAAQILLRPSPDATTQRISYMVGTRLLPLFDQFDPNLATQVRSRLTELSMSIPAGLKSPEVVNKIRKGMNPTDGNEGVQDILDKANHLASSTARDGLYIRAAISAAEQGETKAEKIVQEISSDEVRGQVSAYVFMLLARNALETKRLERALEFARSEDLTPIERVWIYLQAADQIGTKRATQAIDIVFEAVPIARGIRTSHPDRVRAMVGIAVEFMKFNPELAKEYVAEAITEANKTDDFRGEETTLDVRLEIAFGDWGASYAAPNFALKGLFRELVKEDYFQAINKANDLKGQEPRSIAMIAVGQSVLGKSNYSVR